MWVFAIAFVVVFSLALWFFWWRTPQTQVPPHLSDPELRRLEVQDRLRQTQYQVVTAIGLVATFFATVAQLSYNIKQWNTENRLKLYHEQAQVFHDATSDLTKENAAHLAGHAAYRLRNLALENPETYYNTVNEALVSFVRTSTADNNLMRSSECAVPAGSGGNFVDRQEGPAAALAALSVLGDPAFARYGQVYRRGECRQSGLLSTDADVVRLDHFKLDNFDLGNRDFSCSSMTQTRLRRVNFRGTTLAGANLAGARLADFDIDGSPAAIGGIGDTRGFSIALANSLPEWQRYRCFISDLRDADLRDATLTNAALSGVDFRGADMTGADLCGADISRANFEDVRGLTSKMIKRACVGKTLEGAGNDAVDDENQPISKFKVNLKVNRCYAAKHEVCDKIHQCYAEKHDMKACDGIEQCYLAKHDMEACNFPSRH